MFKNIDIYLNPNMVLAIIASSTSWLKLLFISILRPFGTFLLLPAFTAKSLNSTLFKNVLIISITLPIIPIIHTINLTSITENINSLILFVTREILIGLFIGFCAAIPFWAIDMSGYIIDTLRGASMATLLNPTINVQSSLFGVFLTQLFTVVFLCDGGFHALIALIYNSYTIIPPEGSHSLDKNAIDLAKHVWLLMYQICLRLSFPAILIMLITDISLGLINRSAQQLNVFFISMPIKSILVTIIIIITLSFSIKSHMNISNKIYNSIVLVLSQLNIKSIYE